MESSNDLFFILTAVISQGNHNLLSLVSVTHAMEMGSRLTTCETSGTKARKFCTEKRLFLNPQTKYYSFESSLVTSRASKSHAKTGLLKGLGLGVIGIPTPVRGSLGCIFEVNKHEAALRSSRGPCNPRPGAETLDSLGSAQRGAPGGPLVQSAAAQTRSG